MENVNISVLEEIAEAVLATSDDTAKAAASQEETPGAARP
jgi:hypothetical protein